MDIKGEEWSQLPQGHKDSYSWNLLWTWSKPKVSSLLESLPFDAAASAMPLMQQALRHVTCGT